MKLDLKTFGVQIRQIEPNKSVDDANLSPYLMEKLFVPYVTGEDIRLDSLDYDAFELFELDRLSEFIGDVISFGAPAANVRERLQKCAPASRRARGFC